MRSKVAEYRRMGGLALGRRDLEGLLDYIEEVQAAAEDVLGWVDQEWGGLDNEAGASQAGKALNDLMPANCRVEPRA